jgi:hypothetical protein
LQRFGFARLRYLVIRVIQRICRQEQLIMTVKRKNGWVTELLG